MPIGKFLRTVLGLGDSETSESSSTNVTVERDRDDPEFADDEVTADPETADEDYETTDETGPGTGSAASEEEPVSRSTDVGTDTETSEDVDESDVGEASDLDESDEPDVEEASDIDEFDQPDEDVEASAAAGTDAAASTGSFEEDPDSADESTAKPGEAVAQGSGHSGTGTTAAEPAEAAGPVGDDPDGSEAVDTVDGIGPAYAERLEDAGVGTVAQLLDADAAELSGEIDVSEKRISRWQDRAGDE